MFFFIRLYLVLLLCSKIDLDILHNKDSFLWRQSSKRVKLNPTPLACAIFFLQQAIVNSKNRKRRRCSMLLTFTFNSHSIDMKYIKIKGRVICKSIGFQFPIELENRLDTDCLIQKIQNK